MNGVVISVYMDSELIKLLDELGITNRSKFFRLSVKLAVNLVKNIENITHRMLSEEEIMDLLEKASKLRFSIIILNLNLQS